MKILTNKKSLKIISIILIFSILLISIFPVYSIAEEDEDTTVDGIDEGAGGKLFRPVFQLVAGLGDLAMKTLQYYFYGDFNIKDYSENFTFKYGPAAIFSGIVPGLDANFMKSTENSQIVKYDKVVKKDYTMVAEGLNLVDAELVRQYFKNGGAFSFKPDYDKWVAALENAELIDAYPHDNNHNISYDKFDSEKIDITEDFKTKVTHEDSGKVSLGNWSVGAQEIRRAWISEKDNCVYIIIIHESAGSSFYYSANLYRVKPDSVEKLNDLIGEEVTVTEEIVRESTAKLLRGTISKWYKALRLIALVGLLSVLVYVGIRIIISSTGQEKAKYKKMIGDWLVALCILFILHYIMAFTMAIVEDVLEIFSENENIISGKVIDKTTGEIKDPGTDVLLASIRGEIDTTQSYAVMGGFLVIYLVLVIYTVIFTIHYLKRLVYLAFFTMIAPLIALTYPLDKIKDGQAQAFGMWIKEYVFNALMPVMHILLYYIFIGSAMDFAKTNPIYALVCIGFMMPAEKFFRKMFGFDKATTSNQFGAAAGGAMVMNAINKISHAGGNGGSGGKGSKSGSGSSGGDSSPARISNRPDGGSPDQNSPNPDPLDNSNPNLGGGPNPLGARGENIQGTTKRPKFISRGTDGKLHTGVIKGAKNLGKQYFNSANARKGLKALGRGARKGLVGAAGAAALGTAGLAAGIASGDLSKVFQYTAAGAAGGFVGANKAGDKLTELEKKNRDIYNEGRLGTTEFKTRKAIQELQQDNDFNQLCKELGVDNSGDRKRLIRQFSNNGITDPEAIKKAVAAGADNDKVKTGDATGINYMIGAAKIRKQATSQGMSRKDVKELLEQRNVPDVDDALKLIYSM